MISVIREETSNPDHSSYGMFALVIMSHGTETKLISTDGEKIELSTVYNFLSPSQFSAMRGKPKWLIIQACSGGWY